MDDRVFCIRCASILLCILVRPPKFVLFRWILWIKKGSVNMFINISNHPYGKWSIEQREGVKGDILDMPFPQVDPSLDKEGISKLAMDMMYQIGEILDIKGLSPSQVILHVMGEQSLFYTLTHMCKELGYKVVVSTSRREAVEKILTDGTVEKTAIFKFIQFREV